MISLVVFSIIFKKSLQNQSPGIKAMWPIIQEFGLLHPVFIEERKNIKFFKSLTLKNQVVRIRHPDTIMDEYFQGFENVISLCEDVKKLEQVAKMSSTMVIVSDKIHELMQKMTVQIHERIYFFDSINSELYESYQIVSHNITRKLGHVEGNVFIWSLGVRSIFQQRRSNFHGISLKAITDNIANFVKIHPKFEQTATYFPSNETFLVNNFISGFSQDILMELENYLNFTIEVYKSRVTNWGQISKTENGSVNATGMFASIVRGEIDLVLAPFLMTLERVQDVGYIKAVTQTYFGIFIPTHNTKMENDWKILIAPFRFDLWLIILTSTFLMTATDIITSRVLKRVSCNLILGNFWTNFRAYFGGAPGFTDFKVSYQIKSFTSLLAGMIIWFSYQSYLTAELSVNIEKLPFIDSESFSKTDWRYANKVVKSESYLYYF